MDKKREIYFIHNVKFHIDNVKNLGTFIEIEAIDEYTKHTIKSFITFISNDFISAISKYSSTTRSRHASSIKRYVWRLNDKQSCS